MTVGTDTSAINSAIQQFITDYNSLQNYISSQQAVSTSSSGTVTAGPLTADETANDIVSNLRSLSTVAGTGLSTSAINTLGDLGIESSGQNNTLTLSDSSTLDSALANNLSAVQSFFADATNGVATQVNNYITDITGSSGELTRRASHRERGFLQHHDPDQQSGIEDFVRLGAVDFGVSGDGTGGVTSEPGVDLPVGTGDERISLIHADPRNH